MLSYPLTHTLHWATSPALFRVRMGDKSCQVSISSAIACTLHGPHAPLVPFSGDWDEPKNKVTESTLGYLWCMCVSPSSLWNTGVLYVFSSTFLLAASGQPSHGSYTFTNKNRRARKQEANTITWEIWAALVRMNGEATGWCEAWGRSPDFKYS